VRTVRVDPAHHTRLPQYARGALGTVLGEQGAYPLPDDRSRGLPAAPQTVYTVLFSARELFGEGNHSVTLALWEDYLRPAGPGEESSTDER
jgi:nitrile hydratase